MLERNLVNCGTNPGIVSCSGMRQKGNLTEFVVIEQVRRQPKIVQAKRKDLVDSAKARCQEASSTAILIFSFISNSYF